MNKTQEQLLHILKITINKELPNMDLLLMLNSQELFELAIQQDIYSILYPTLNKYSQEIKINEMVFSNWKAYSMSLAIQQISMLSEVNKIFSLFSNNNVTAISLKGLVLMQLYSNPELRKMSDIDLLVNENNIDKSIKLLENQGYSTVDEKDNSEKMHVCMVKPGAYPIEIHRTLYHPLYLRDRNDKYWTKHIWANIKKVEINGIIVNTLALEDELINLVIHLATHLLYSGASLKQICDLALFIKTYWNSLDKVYIENALNSMGFYTFFQYILKVCNLYLGLSIIDNVETKDIDKCNNFIEDIFNIETLSKTSNESECWRVLSIRYPYAWNNPIYIPLSIVLETGLQVIRNKRNVFVSFIYANKSFRSFKSRVDLLRSLGVLK